jgi:hypothetical protein
MLRYHLPEEQTDGETSQALALSPDRGGTGKQPGRRPSLVTHRESHKGQAFLLQRRVRIAQIPAQNSPRSTISHWVVCWVVS